MKILVVTNDMMDGGSGWLIADAIPHLLAAGVRVTISKPARDRHPTSVRLRSLGAKERYRVVPSRWPIRMLKSLDRRHRARKLLLAERPDLVVFNQLSQTDDNDWLPFLRDLRVPHLTLCHLVSDTVGRSDARMELMRDFYSSATMACFVARRSLALCELQIGQRLRNSRIVVNPVRVPRDAPLSWPSGPTLQLAMAGRLDPENKGQDILFEVLAGDAWRERDFHLHLYGKGGAEQGLRRTATMLGLESRVTFHGYSNDVPAIWRDRHVCLMPSRHESMPISMIEAMPLGRPVLATDVAGMPELVEDEVSGFVAAACTPTALGLAMERLWRSRERLAAMGENARRRALKHQSEDPGRDFAALILQTCPRQK